MDESILFFSRVFLSIFSLEALFLLWVKGVFILGWEWNVKSQVFQNRASSWLDWVASSSREVTKWPFVLFCPVELQLTWCFNFWHAWHVCSLWQLATTSHPQVPIFLAHSWANLHTISLTTLTKIPPGDFKVTTPENSLLSQQAVTSKGIQVPYTNI